MSVEARLQQALALIRGEGDDARPPWPLEEHWADVLALLEQHHHALFDLVAEVAQQVGAVRGSLMLLDEKTGELVVRVTCGPGAQGTARRLRLGEGVAGAVAADGCPMVSDDASRDARVSEPGSHLRSLLCVPVILAGQTLGVLNLCDKRPGFSRTDLALAMGAADALAALLAESPLHRLSGVQFRRSLSGEVQRAGRYQRPLCLMAVSFDASHRRKAIVAQTADLERIVANNIRTCDILGRLSGEVLGVILPETPAKGARWLAQRIVESSDRVLKARARVGVCALSRRRLGDAELISRAEMALRMAGNGGPRVQLYREPSPN